MMPLVYRMTKESGSIRQWPMGDHRDGRTLSQKERTDGRSVAFFMSYTKERILGACAKGVRKLCSINNFFHFPLQGSLLGDIKTAKLTIGGDDTENGSLLYISCLIFLIILKKVDLIQNYMEMNEKAQQNM